MLIFNDVAIQNLFASPFTCTRFFAAFWQLEFHFVVHIRDPTGRNRNFTKSCDIPRSQRRKNYYFLLYSREIKQNMCTCKQTNKQQKFGIGSGWGGRINTDYELCNIGWVIDVGKSGGQINWIIEITYNVDAK